MSYVIHVWEEPRPASLDDAVRIAFDLGEDVIGQNPGFLVLAGRLVARYPCITTDPDGVWSDGPLDGKTEERAYVLGISDRHAQVVAFVVECAGKLGLTVFDMQAGCAWLPSGQLLETGAAAPAWIDQLSPMDIRAAVLDGLMRVLGPFGFGYVTQGEPALQLAFPGGLHRIVVPIADRHPVYAFSFTLMTKLDAVAAITGAGWATVNDGYFHGESGKQYTVDSRPALALAVTAMNIAAIDKLLPLLDLISDVPGMEALYNAAGPFSKDDGHIALILARLAGNPDYAAMRAPILAAVHPGNRALRRLIDYLDDYDAHHPAPPPAWPQDDAACFIADYDGTQFDEIDANATLRDELMHEAGPALQTFSLRLLRDMFRAQARACVAGQDFDSRAIAALSLSLLTRGGVGELALFAESIPDSALSVGAMAQLPFAAELAESLRYACEERTSNPMFGERTVQYAALEKYFAAIAARGHA